MHKKFYLTFLLFSCALAALAQGTLVNGVVSTGKLKPVENASVVLRSFGSNSLAKFTFTNAKGEFSIELPIKLPDSILVEINCMGYKPFTSKVWANNKEANFSFTLQEAKFELPAVTVKNSGITQKKDTIAYDIQKLKTPADDVLEDVLKRLPGIEVGDDGSIKYQGKNINKYYIEGLDMLGDKYALANRNLAAKHIAQVQVLENHQPIKMYDSLVPSQRAALNIKLTSAAKNKLLGKASLAAGVPNILVDAGVNAMQFANAKQYLHVYKFNNAGNNYTDELKRFNQGDFTEIFTGNLERTDLLSIPLAQAPTLNQNRLLFNNQHILSINQLSKLKKDATLQLQVDGTLDKNIQTATENNQLFFLNDTIVFTERQQLTQRPWQLAARAEYTQNTKLKYLVNTSVVNFFGANNFGSIVNNGASSRQQFSNFQGNASNAFQQVRLLNKWRFTLKHFISFSSLQQQLVTSPNGNLNTWLQVADSSFVRQRLQLTTAYQKIQSVFSRSAGKFTLSQQVGYSTLLQRYTPVLQQGMSDKQFVNLANDSFSIQENITQHLPEATSTLGFKTSDFSASISATVQALVQNKAITPTLGNFHVLPGYTALANYTISSRWAVVANSSLNQFFDRPFQTNASFILNDFRNILNANNLTGFQLTQSNSIQFNYKNVLKASFMSFGVSLDNTRFNTIQIQQFINTLSVGSKTLFSNQMGNTNVFASASRYFFKLRMSGSLQTNYQQSQTVQATQAGIVNSNIGTVAIGAKLGRVIGSINVDYATRFQHNTIQQLALNKINSSDWFNTLTVTKAFKSNWLLKAGLEQYQLTASGRPNQSFFFGDISITKKQALGKMDISFLWQNVTNTQAFINNFSFGNSFTQNSFQLRPSQVMVKIQRSF